MADAESVLPGWSITTVVGDESLLAIETPDGKTWFTKRGERLHALAAAIAVQPAEVSAAKSAAELFAVEMLDFQPLTERNCGARLWQILEAGGIPDGLQVSALLGALRHALGARA